MKCNADWLPFCLHTTGPLSAPEVKHLQSLGTRPSGDANEDREAPLTMHVHTQHLCQQERVGWSTMKKRELQNKQGFDVE